MEGAVVKLVLFDKVLLLFRKVAVRKQVATKIVWPFKANQIAAGTARLRIGTIASFRFRFVVRVGPGVYHGNLQSTLLHAYFSDLLPLHGRDARYMRL
jgi:hypothetical protein